MVKVLASHQCDPGLNAGPGIIIIECGLNSLLILIFALRALDNTSKFQFDLETVEEEPLCGYATTNS